MRTMLLILLITAGVVSTGNLAASAGNPKPHKHRAVNGIRNNLPPGFGAASGSSGEGTTDGAALPDEPADDGDDSSSSASASPTGQAAPATPTVAAPPQVVTDPTSKAPVTVTASKVVLPPPPCLNHPDYPVVPTGWTVKAGNCSPPQPRGEDNYLACHGDEAKLVAYSGVDNLMKSGYVMGIWVDGVPEDRHGHCIITDLATYKLDPGKFVFSGMYVGDGGPGDGKFDSPVPYPWSAWKPLYPYWVPRTQAAQYVQAQSLLSIQAYGLLWSNGSRYQSANAFSRYLTKHHQRWRIWKRQNPAFATALTSHETLLRRLKRR
jgi:hypothetical protein